MFDKFDGEYYPRVAFLRNSEGTLSYVTNARSYDQGIEFMKEHESKNN
jgi:hypothetical protein